MMQPDICQYLAQKTPLLADGAMGTLLLQRGFQAPFELLNLAQPEIIQGIHVKYLKAGARVLYTHTFLAGPKQYPKNYQEIIKAAVRNLKKASEKYLSERKGKAGGSIYPGSPLGEQGVSRQDPLLRSSFSEASQYWIAGNIGPLEEGFEKVIPIFLTEKIDFFAFETFAKLVELQKIKKVLSDLKPKVPVLISIALNREGRLFDGTDLKSVCDFLKRAPCDLVGLNCGSEPKVMLPFFQEMKRKVSKPFVLKLNAGLPPAYLTPKEYAAQIRPYIKEGVAILGGCCGTTPETIAGLNQTFLDPQSRRVPPYRSRKS